MGRRIETSQSQIFRMGVLCSRVWTSSRGQWGSAERSDLCFIKTPVCCVVWAGRGEGQHSNQDGGGWNVGGGSRERGKGWIRAALKR